VFFHNIYFAKLFTKLTFKLLNKTSLTYTSQSMYFYKQGDTIPTFSTILCGFYYFLAGENQCKSKSLWGSLLQVRHKKVAKELKSCEILGPAYWRCSKRGTSQENLLSLRLHQIPKYPLTLLYLLVKSVTFHGLFEIDSLGSHHQNAWGISYSIRFPAFRFNFGISSSLV